MSMTMKKLQITVTAESPVRVGGSRDPVRGIDLPMATVGGRPVVPGASLKGAFRAELAGYLVEKGKSNPHLRPCIPAAKRSPQEEGLIGFKSEACALDEEGGGKPICPACYLLGAPGLVGFVRIPFLYASISQEELVELPINYATRTGRNVGPRTLEFVPKGATLSGIVELVLRDSVRDWELGKVRPQFQDQDRWLADGKWSGELIEKELVRDRLEAITSLGGAKSRGYGNVSVKVTDPRS